MSYLSWADRRREIPRQLSGDGPIGAIAADGYYRSAPHTVQQLDILAIQRLYGAARDTPLSGGQVDGFHCNIAGPIHDFFDFTENTQPVVTLYNQGTGNTLDVSGVVDAATINLNPGTFSSVGGFVNNRRHRLRNADQHGSMRRRIRHVVGNDNGDVLSGGGGGDTIQGGNGNDLIDGGIGEDVLNGGAGDDTYLVDSGFDEVIEAAAGGYDTVKATAAFYTLGCVDRGADLYRAGACHRNRQCAGQPPDRQHQRRRVERPRRRRSTDRRGR